MNHKHWSILSIISFTGLRDGTFLSAFLTFTTYHCTLHTTHNMILFTHFWNIIAHCSYEKWWTMPNFRYVLFMVIVAVKWKSKYMSNHSVFIILFVFNFYLKWFEVPFDYWTLKMKWKNVWERRISLNLIIMNFMLNFAYIAKILLVIARLSNFEDIPIYINIKHILFILYIHIRNMMRISTPVSHSQRRM